ncbi:hypothetical protein EI94DRAFT_1708113 [Lactarius quietus]|nr:hypothetical protein EI94DRAFT_1708113 [Lactarius quietus]
MCDSPIIPVIIDRLSLLAQKVFPDELQVTIKSASLLHGGLVPTGVTKDSRAKTLDECHAALVQDNPSYTSLNVTQKPSWVRNPNSYSEGAVSSLVVAFEDLDGSLACGLLSKKVVYVFGHCATLKKWKQSVKFLDRNLRRLVRPNETEDELIGFVKKEAKYKLE